MFVTIALLLTGVVWLLIGRGEAPSPKLGCYSRNLVENQVYFHKKRTRIGHEDPFFWYEKIPLPEVDVDSFEYVKTTECMGKDKNHVYVADKIVEDVKPSNFVALENLTKYNLPHFFKNDEHVYFQVAGLADELVTLDLDPAEVSVLPNGYIKDRKKVYYYDEILSGADPLNFQVIENESSAMAVDGKSVFYAGSKVIGITDPASWQRLSHVYAKEGISRIEKKSIIMMKY